MVATVLTGGHPEPLIRRSRTHVGWRTRRASANAPSWLAQVVEVVAETPSAGSLWLERVDGGRIDFLPGQFLVVEVVVDGASLRRAYSISSASSDGRRVRITIKRAPGGRASSFLTETVRVGHRLPVHGPSGRFTAGSGPDGRHVLMIGGGAGSPPSGASPIAC
jgi:ferredoxin-NADP reductase